MATVAATMTPIAKALTEAMALRGITTADLARDVGRNQTTLGNIVAGKVRIIRNREVRDALDDYFAPGIPHGTTLRICKGDVESYPTNALYELVSVAQELPEPAQRSLTTFVREARAG